MPRSTLHFCAKSILFGALFVLPPLACARRERLSEIKEPTVAAASLPEGVYSAPPFISPTADPLCGDHWKWDGVRCVQLESAKTSEAATFAPAGRTARAPSAPPPEAAPVQVPTKDLKVGTGPEAVRGDMVRIHYVGTLADGKEFDSSRKRNEPFEFRLGSGSTIKGFDAAVTGMKVGGVRRATIPPDLGYGRRGQPPVIPPNATLVFEVELLEIISNRGE